MLFRSLGPGGETLVNGDKSFRVQLDANAFQAKVRRVGHSTHSHQHAVAPNGLAFFTLNDAGRKELRRFWEKWEFVSSKIDELKEKKQ